MAGRSGLSFAERSEAFLSLAMIGVLVVLLVPLHPALLDMLLALNLSFTVLLLLITLGVTHPLDISVLPSLLLLMTLFRLSLNVATTRLILLHGDAGRIVTTFGGFVAGGNIVVGLVIFLILVTVQFIVITKGAGRVSEVTARFTLDALPGKQMAVDAELTAGTIDESEARRQRADLARETEFYGAMDGASKFVRGDAIAGLVITGVNLLGGIIIGVSNGLSLGDAGRRFSILTIGDGLVSQIPALIVATTVGMVVTKAASNISLGHELGSQLTSNRRALTFGAVIIGLLALTPGLPKLWFAVVAIGLFIAARRSASAVELSSTDTPNTEADKASTTHGDDISFDGFLQTDRVTLEVGARLIPLVEMHDSKGITDRVSRLRSDLVEKYGIWVPAVRIRDNLQLEPEAYRILVCEKEVGRGMIKTDQFLVLDVLAEDLPVPGLNVRDPAFQLPACWIAREDKSRVEFAQHTVVDAPSVLTTHFGEILKKYAHELLSRQDLQQLLDTLKATAPSLVDEIRPDGIRIGVLHQVLVSLLREKVPITDMSRILESLSENYPQIKEPLMLAERVRENLGRDICDRFRGPDCRVRVIVLDPRLEGRLRDMLHNGSLTFQPSQLEKLVAALNVEWKKSTLEGLETAILTDSALRFALRRSLERSLPDLAVIAYAEVPHDLMIEPVAMLRTNDVFADTEAHSPLSEGEHTHDSSVKYAVA